MKFSLVNQSGCYIWLFVRIFKMEHIFKWEVEGSSGINIGIWTSVLLLLLLVLLLLSSCNFFSVVVVVVVVVCLLVYFYCLNLFLLL